MLVFMCVMVMAMLVVVVICVFYLVPQYQGAGLALKTLLGTPVWLGPLAVGDKAGSAESLWVQLSQTLPEPWRVEALVLLAFSAYARGDGPLAGISLDAALRCGPHRMAGMLDQALQAGMRPDQIRELADTGYRLATQLGVRLPPKRWLRRRAS